MLLLLDIGTSSITKDDKMSYITKALLESLNLIMMIGIDLGKGYNSLVCYIVYRNSIDAVKAVKVVINNLTPINEIKKERAIATPGLPLSILFDGTPYQYTRNSLRLSSAVSVVDPPPAADNADDDVDDDDVDDDAKNNSPDAATSDTTSTNKVKLKYISVASYQVEKKMFSSIIEKLESSGFLSKIGIRKVGITGDLKSFINLIGAGIPTATYFCPICLVEKNDTKNKKITPLPSTYETPSYPKRNFDDHMKVMNCVLPQPEDIKKQFDSKWKVLNQADVDKLGLTKPGIKIPETHSQKYISILNGFYGNIFITTLHIMLGLVNTLIDYYKELDPKNKVTIENYLKPIKQTRAVGGAKAYGAQNSLIGPEVMAVINSAEDYKFAKGLCTELKFEPKVTQMFMDIIRKIEGVSEYLMSNDYLNDLEVTEFVRRITDLCKLYRSQDCPLNFSPKLHHLEIHVAEFVKEYHYLNIFGEGRIEQSHQTLFNTLKFNQHYGHLKLKQLSNAHLNILIRLMPESIAFKNLYYDAKKRNIVDHDSLSDEEELYMSEDEDYEIE